MPPSPGAGPGLPGEQAPDASLVCRRLRGRGPAGRTTPQCWCHGKVPWEGRCPFLCLLLETSSLFS